MGSSPGRMVDIGAAVIMRIPSILPMPRRADPLQPNTASTAEFSRIATASATPSSGNGNRNGSPFGASGTNSAPSSSVNVQKSAWAVFALLTAVLSL